MAFSITVAIQFNYSLVYSKISYGIELFGVASASTLKSLQVLQNRILTITTFSQWRYPTNKLHSNLGVLKVDDIQVLKTCTFVYKYVNSKLPQIFYNTVHPRGALHIPNPTRNYPFHSTPNSKHGKLPVNNYCYKI